MNDIQSDFEKKLESHTDTLRVTYRSDIFYGITSGSVTTPLGTYVYNSTSALNELYTDAFTLYEATLQDGQLSWKTRYALALKTIDNLVRAGKYELDSESSNSKVVTYRPLDAMVKYVQFCKEESTKEDDTNSDSSLGVAFYGVRYNPGDLI